MPSGSKKSEYSDEQYRRQLEHSRVWKERNRERVRAYNRAYNAKRRARHADATTGDMGIRH